MLELKRDGEETSYITITGTTTQMHEHIGAYMFTRKIVHNYGNTPLYMVARIVFLWEECDQVMGTFLDCG